MLLRAAMETWRNVSKDSSLGGKTNLPHVVWRARSKVGTYLFKEHYPEYTWPYREESLAPIFVESILTTQVSKNQANKHKA